MGVFAPSKYAAPIIALAVLMACGGEQEEGTPPLVYRGNTNPAVVTTQNAAAITANVLSTPPEVSIASSVGAAGQSGILNIGRHLHRTLRATAARNGVFGAKPSSCDSGAVRVSGVLGENGLGTISLDFNACRIGDTTVNGSATMRIDASDTTTLDEFLGPTDYTITFDRLTLAGGLTAALAGSMHTHLNVETRTETITENMVVLFGNGAMAKSEKLIYANVYESLVDPPRLSSQSISGRVFNSIHGWIDVSTVEPLRFIAAVSPEGGVLVLSAERSAIRFAIRSQTHVEVGMDLDGNGIVERSVLLAWSELNAPVGADLGDTDGDGMHDGWEAANGLNVNDASDAGVDADGDGASNWQEYDALTDARNASSVPPSVGLSIQMTVSPDPASMSFFVTYRLRVSTSGPPAKDVVLSNIPPASAGVFAVRAEQGSCAGTAPVVCRLGTVGSKSVFVEIVVAPTVEAVITSTATVSTTSFDPDVSDNSATGSVIVGPPVEEVPTL